MRQENVELQSRVERLGEEKAELALQVMHSAEQETSEPLPAQTRPSERTCVVHQQ